MVYQAHQALPWSKIKSGMKHFVLLFIRKCLEKGTFGWGNNWNDFINMKIISNVFKEIITVKSIDIVFIRTL